MRSDTLGWIQSFLSYRKQQVVLECTSSSQASVISGVPQGTVLGRCCFLLSSVTCLSVLHQTLDCSLMTHYYTDILEAIVTLRLYSVTLMHWKNGKRDRRWNSIQTNTRSSAYAHPGSTDVKQGHTLEIADSATYLGVTISQNLTWKNHAGSIAAKASRTLSFLRRNLYSCNRDVREKAYKSLVLPTLWIHGISLGPTHQCRYQYAWTCAEKRR